MVLFTSDYTAASLTKQIYCVYLDSNLFCFGFFLHVFDYYLLKMLAVEIAQ